MSTLDDLLRGGRPASHHAPWPRVTVDRAAWDAAIEQLAGGHLTLLGLWPDAATVHMALLDEPAQAVGVISLACDGGRYPSVARLHPPALRLERALRDLSGLIPDGLPDTRPWLDHGQWGPNPEPPDYAFLPCEGEGLHQVAVGPVHAGIIEPGHFRFTVNGETVVRLEQRLGYTHKGTEALMAGADLATGARLAGRVSGDSTVAYALAFARAVEAALGVIAPPRAVFLRALMAEWERLANHLGDIGAVCNDASFVLMQAHCAILRERMLRVAADAFGHRLMRDRIVPGGVTADLDAAAGQAMRELVADIRRRFPALVELYENTASLQDRTVTAGMLGPELARQYGAGGYVGRASGRPFDSRRALAYPPYDRLAFDVPVFPEGDVNARVWVRIREVEQSLALVEEIVDRLPRGTLRADLPQPGEPREGMALVEGFRGDVLVWLRLGADGRIARCSLRDPSWFQWPLLEAAIKGNIVADFPLCNKSFNCSYSGHDL
ncbi:MAG: hydrogenase expression protein HypE [Xanthobacteraceae bacterium]|nr:MAG: hydrogenase expression protein HypE [Xanthobacteraceae bacterium]